MVGLSSKTLTDFVYRSNACLVEDGRDLTYEFVNLDEIPITYIGSSSKQSLIGADKECEREYNDR